VLVSLDMPSEKFLFLSGRLSPEPLELAFASRIVRSGDTFVDVGAHWGLYILHVLGRLGDTGRYIAIEPSRSNSEFLGNAFPRDDKRIEFLELAVAEVDGDGMLESGAEGDVNAHLSKEGRGVPVRVARLDTALRELSMRHGKMVVKVDTEGYEAAVVRGAAGLAAAGIRPIFLLEFLPERFKQTRADILDAIEQTFGPDYSLWAIDATRGCLVQFEHSAVLSQEIRNIVAVPNDSLDRLESCPRMALNT
jgi:FkbM family methyltransferase